LPNRAELAAGVLHSLMERVRYIEQERLGQRAMPAPLVRALKIIESDITAELTVDNLAYRAMVSSSYLTALFRRHCSRGPMQYVQDARLAQAKRLLTDPYVRIRDVGRLCGYDDPNYFSRLFALRSGMSPTQYRRNAVGGR
jgi:transcriptional regulator GlxA family with amidase domain